MRAGYAALVLFFAAALAAGSGVPARADTSSGSLGSGALQFNKVPYPKTTLHASYVIEINRKGQVSRVRSGVSSHDAFFDAMTYGNVVQAFIRTPDGRAISGLYRMSYAYDPATHKIKRTVSMLQEGGVDPWAVGYVDAMAAQNQAAMARFKRELEKIRKASPAPTRAP